MVRMLSAVIIALLCASAQSVAEEQVENILDPAIHPYQEFGANNCTLSGDCNITFAKVTFVKTVIRHVSCTFDQVSTATVGSAVLSMESENGSNALPVFTYSTASGTTNYGINTDTYLILPDGEQPRIDVFGDSGAIQSLVCTISGYHS